MRVLQQPLRQRVVGLRKSRLQVELPLEVPGALAELDEVVERIGNAGDGGRAGDEGFERPARGTGASKKGGDLIYGTYAATAVLGELLLRSYSREFEDESDEDGQRWAAAAG